MASIFLEVKADGRGLLKFEYPQGGLAGEFTVITTVRSNHGVIFNAGRWIKRPPNAASFTLTGKLSANGKMVVGSANRPCGEFDIARTDPPPKPDQPPKVAEKAPSNVATSPGSQGSVSVEGEVSASDSGNSLRSKFAAAAKASQSSPETEGNTGQNSSNGSAGGLILAGFWQGNINCGANGNKKLSIRLTPRGAGATGEMMIWKEEVGGRPAYHSSFSLTQLRAADRAQVQASEIKVLKDDLPHVETFKTLKLSIDRWPETTLPFPGSINVMTGPNWGCSTYASVSLSHPETLQMALEEPLRNMAEVQKTVAVPEGVATFRACNASTTDAFAGCLIEVFRTGLPSDSSLATSFVYHVAETLVRPNQVQTCDAQRKRIKSDLEVLRGRGLKILWQPETCRAVADLYSAVANGAPYYATCSSGTETAAVAACARKILDHKMQATMAASLYAKLVQGLPEPTHRTGGLGNLLVYQLGETARQGGSGTVSSRSSEISNELYACKANSEHKVSPGKFAEVLNAARTGMEEPSNAQSALPPLSCASFGEMLAATGLITAGETEGVVGFDKCGPDRRNRPPLRTEVQKSTAYQVTAKMCNSDLVYFLHGELGNMVSEFEYRDATCVHGAFSFPLTKFGFDFVAKECTADDGKASCEGEVVIYCDSTSREKFWQGLTCGNAESVSLQTTASYAYDQSACEWKPVAQDVRKNERRINR
ncbi:hypothetical protein M0654_22240 [Rhizobium sp. NTR19]|uniref:Uncharacterized protein n=1 Tax=Neorhizobium turbinariae TaxID=2937795 RepID=A0ABT0IXS4_9HYPH|nr:hypothetical protein [Neorhizobium turbinariae]MCK8782689.1 hypothetical protein [Neorhizobium turbinariae]